MSSNNYRLVKLNIHYCSDYTNTPTGVILATTVKLTCNLLLVLINSLSFVFYLFFSLSAIKHEQISTFFQAVMLKQSDNVQRLLLLLLLFMLFNKDKVNGRILILCLLQVLM